MGSGYLKFELKSSGVCSDLFRVHVELFPPHGDLFVSLCGFAGNEK